MNTDAFLEGMGDTQRRIFEAADRLFCSHGYDGVSIRDVADEAGANKASVFYHFNSKEELFEQVLERYYVTHRQVLEGALEGEGGLRDRLRAAINAYIDFIEENRRYPRLVQGLVTRGDSHASFVERSLTPLFLWTVDALTEVAPVDGPTGARHFFLTFSGAVVNYFTYAPTLEKAWGDDPMADDQIQERREHLLWLVDTCLDGILRDVNG